MPPYAGEESTTMVATREEMHDAFYADITSPIKAPNAMPNDDDNSTAAESQEQPESPGKLDFILDFNPCQSMSSAVFKVRTCSYCGHSCSKLKGYKKEVVESADGGIEKIYFHKWCSQLKDWKAIHATQWKNVMDSMMGNFRAAERAVADERTRRETEAAAALELQTQQMMEDVDLLESASRGDVAAKSANKRSVGSRIGKTFKAFTAAMGCKGNNNKAVDEEATKKQS